MSRLYMTGGWSTTSVSPSGKETAYGVPGMSSSVRPEVSRIPSTLAPVSVEDRSVCLVGSTGRPRRCAVTAVMMFTLAAMSRMITTPDPVTPLSEAM